MATGDLRNNLDKLKTELRSTCVHEDQIDTKALAAGNPVGFLPLLHAVLLDNSLLVARYLSERGYQLFPIDDKTFLEGVLRVVRNEFSYRPSLTLDQFLSKGFAERKIIFLCDVVKLCKRKAEELDRLNRESNKVVAPRLPTEPTPPSASVATATAKTGKAGKAGKVEEARGRRQSGPASPLRKPSAKSRRGQPHGQPRAANIAPGPFEGHVYGSDSSDGSSNGRSANGHELERGGGGAASSHSSRRRPVPSLPGTPPHTTQRGAYGSSWRPERALTLQTGAHAYGEETRSPASSGPVSPVSITSAASAPVVSRQAPIRAKPEMIGQIGMARVPPSEGDLHSTATPLAPANRAMECWVTSPPQTLERQKKKDAHSMHLANPHVSPRLRSRASNGVKPHRQAAPTTLAATVRRGGMVPSPARLNTALAQLPGSQAQQPRQALRPRSAEGDVDRASTAWAGSEGEESAQARSVRSFGNSWNATPSSRPESASSDSQSIARKLSLPSSAPGASPQSPPGKGSADLADQVSRMIATLSTLTSVPERLEAMERKMVTALETMDQRISDLDSRVRLLGEDADGRRALRGPGTPGRETSVAGVEDNASATPSGSASPAAAAAAVSVPAVVPGAATSSANTSGPSSRSNSPQNILSNRGKTLVPAKHTPRVAKRHAANAFPGNGSKDPDGFDDFLKVIEERFRQTENMLQQSENPAA